MPVNTLINKIASLNWLFCAMIILFLIFIFKNPDISLMIFAAMVIACSLNPMVDKLSAKMPRTIASAVVLFGSIILLCAVLIPLLITCVYEIGTFAIDFPNHLGSIHKIMVKYPFLHKFCLHSIDLRSFFSVAAKFSSQFINNTIAFFQGLSSVFIYVLLTVIFIFYLLADKDGITNSALKMFPEKLRDRVKQIIDTIAQKLGGYIIAQACAIASVGVVMLIGLLLFRVPYAPILAMITAIFDIVPVVGPALALVISLVSCCEAGLAATIAVIVVFAAAQLIENNFVRPYAFGKLLDIHPMLVFIFLFISTKYFGIIGTLFAPAIAATVCVLVDELYIKNLK